MGNKYGGLKEKRVSNKLIFYIMLGFIKLQDLKNLDAQDLQKQANLAVSMNRFQKVEKGLRMINEIIA